MSAKLSRAALAGAALFGLCAILFARPPAQNPLSSPSTPRSNPPLTVAQQESVPGPKGISPEKTAGDHGWVGMMLEDKGGHGPRVEDIFPGGPAAFGGARVGDVLVRIGDTPVTSAASATAAIERLAPRQQTSITVERRGKTIELKVIVDSLAEFRQQYVNEMLRRDPRHPKYAVHPGISESDMTAELVRRLFEQHERLERKLNEVLTEVHELRQEVRALKK